MTKYFAPEQEPEGRKKKALVHHCYYTTREVFLMKKKMSLAMNGSNTDPLK